jgi:hypothetical protein
MIFTCVALCSGARVIGRRFSFARDSGRERIRTMMQPSWAAKLKE